MNNLVTIDSILAWLKDKVEQKIPVSPGTFIDAALKLNVLIGEEHSKLFELQQKVAQIKLNFLNSQEKLNVSESKLRTEATDEYKEMHRQKAKIGQIEEYIRICKLLSRMKETEMSNYNL